MLEDVMSEPVDSDFDDIDLLESNFYSDETDSAEFDDEDDADMDLEEYESVEELEFA